MNNWFDIRETKATELIDRALLLALACQTLQQYERFWVYVNIADRLIRYRLHLLEREF